MGARSGVEGIYRFVAPAHQAQADARQAHDAPLLRLSFAHPLHGSLIASCSHDRTVRIWEEPSASTSNGGNREGRWLEKGILTGAKGSVRAVEFAPPSPAFGLRVVGRVPHANITRDQDADIDCRHLYPQTRTCAYIPPSTLILMTGHSQTRSISHHLYQPAHQMPPIPKQQQ